MTNRTGWGVEDWTEQRKAFPLFVFSSPSLLRSKLVQRLMKTVWTSDCTSEPRILFTPKLNTICSATTPALRWNLDQLGHAHLQADFPKKRTRMSESNKRLDSKTLKQQNQESKYKKGNALDWRWEDFFSFFFFRDLGVLPTSLAFFLFKKWTTSTNSTSFLLRHLESSFHLQVLPELDYRTSIPQPINCQMVSQLLLPLKRQESSFAIFSTWARNGHAQLSFNSNWSLESWSCSSFSSTGFWSEGYDLEPFGCSEK